MRKKPDWFTARNPNGTVPTLERDNTVIYESPVTIEWLDAVYPSVGSAPVVPADPTVRAQQKMAVERLSGVSQYRRR
jgi:glutathione S-transferase